MEHHESGHCDAPLSPMRHMDFICPNEKLWKGTWGLDINEIIVACNKVDKFWVDILRLKPSHRNLQHTYILGTCQSVEEIVKIYTNSEFMRICYEFLNTRFFYPKISCVPSPRTLFCCSKYISTTFVLTHMWHNLGAYSRLIHPA